MSYLYNPDVPKLRGDETREEREQLYKEFVGKLRRYNPGRFNADGSVKTCWQYLKSFLANNK